MSPFPALRRARRACTGALLALASAAAGCSSTPDLPTQAPAVAETATLVRSAMRPLAGRPDDYDALLALVGDARIVLLGESTHGTHEYYRERARITQRLVREKGFTAVAVEGDWPESFRVNEYVRGRGGDATPEQALSGFTRFPTWMWANADVRDLVAWLRAHNGAQPDASDVGFYGLDVYSLASSIEAVNRHLGTLDPALAERVRGHYRCFDAAGGDPQRYGELAVRGGGASCRDAATAALELVRQRAAARPAAPAAAESLFSTLRNAQAVANAEAYFRTLYEGRESTWNLRDRRMAEGLEALEGHVAALTGRPARIVVWMHNTHVGDARHTESGEQGELNVGQLVRERLGVAAVNVGFFTHRGTVFAATEWDRPGRVFDLRPALAGSVSDVFHAATTDAARDFLLVMRGGGSAADALAVERLERAVGVVYAPQSERQSHYFRARRACQCASCAAIASGVMAKCSACHTGRPPRSTNSCGDWCGTPSRSATRSERARCPVTSTPYTGTSGYERANSPSESRAPALIGQWAPCLSSTTSSGAWSRSSRSCSLVRSFIIARGVAGAGGRAGARVQGQLPRRTSHAARRTPPGDERRTARSEERAVGVPGEPGGRASVWDRAIARWFRSPVGTGG
ncbi:MAG TPA: erythromycin esterase family protein [Gemmatirosa sp.]|nr:erythromycin esterase family protein [Gemmatirosa sp.]